MDPLTRTTIKAASRGDSDLYHHALRMSWPRFFVALAGLFLIVNSVFAALYMLGDAAIAGTRSGSFADHFFFSVQTLATIGYGVMYPKSLYGNVLVTVEAMIGLLGVGLVAALAFARFSLPRSRVRFSAVVVVTQFEGVRTMMIRVANERRNSILNARAQVSLLRTEVTSEGHRMRRFYDLDLARAETPIFALSWLILHPLVNRSPLQELTREELERSEFSVLVTITGLDETLLQTVHARHAYFNSDVRWEHRFVDMIDEIGEGRRVVDLTKIDATEPTHQ